VPGKRESSDKRREQLIRATIRSVAQRGLAGTTIERITSAAGVSRGLVHHYYPDKNALLSAAYESLGRRMLDAFKGGAALSDDPLERLMGAVRASFEPPLFRQTEVAAWHGFQQGARSNSHLRALNNSFYQEYRSTMGQLVEEATAQRGQHLPTLMIAETLTLLLDGLWLNAFTDPSAITRDKAVTLCSEYLACTLHLNADDLYVLAQTRVREHVNGAAAYPEGSW
jgi:TetR/AcrR family transcriptional regulator, transcriptional repressor of bet genes